ncbi:flavin-containing monooxygenase [Nocardia rhamnosiphila]
MVQNQPIDPPTSIIEEAIDQADLNALRLSLIQATGDEALAAMKVEKFPYGSGFSHSYQLTAEDSDIVKAAAARYFRSPRPAAPARTSKEETRRLMSLFTGEELTDREFEFGYDELALEDFPHDSRWSREVSPARIAKHHVVVVGAGVCGIAMGVQLSRLGIPYTILERQEGVGGTWLLNDYPEARVDVSSYLYQFKFEKTYRWKERYASQSATRDYLQYIAEKFDVVSHVRTGAEVQSAHWDEDAAEWSVRYRAADGETSELRAKFVISASGLFSTPKIPDFPGMDTFGGTVMHSTRWDHSCDIAGKRVALVGIGSSGAQMAPHLAAQAESLTIFQRTPQWMSPRPDYRDKVSDAQYWLLNNMPFYWNWFVFGLFASQIGLQQAQELDDEGQGDGFINQFNSRLRDSLTQHIKRKVGDDPALLEKVLPDYAPMGRRLVVDNGFYDTLRLPNVELVTTPIEAFVPDGIRTSDEAERKIDVVVLATGFEVSKYFHPVRYTGRDGATLDELWAEDGPRAYLGLAMPGFPNFFSFYGPNGQTRAGGFFFWAESWAHYTGDAIVRLIENGWRSLEVKRSVYDDYNARLDKAMEKLLWAREGAGSYYVNEFGRPGSNMPWRAEEYHGMIQSPDFEDYIVQE